MSHNLAILLATFASALTTNAILFLHYKRKERRAYEALNPAANWNKLRQQLQAAYEFCDKHFLDDKQPRRYANGPRTFLETVTNHDPGVQVLKCVLGTMDQLEGKTP